MDPDFLHVVALLGRGCHFVGLQIGTGCGYRCVKGFVDIHERSVHLFAGAVHLIVAVKMVEHAAQLPWRTVEGCRRDYLGVVHLPEEQ